MNEESMYNTNFLHLQIVSYASKFKGSKKKFSKCRKTLVQFFSIPVVRGTRQLRRSVSSDFDYPSNWLTKNLYSLQFHLSEMSLVPQTVLTITVDSANNLLPKNSNPKSDFQSPVGFLAAPC